MRLLLAHSLAGSDSFIAMLNDPLCAASALFAIVEASIIMFPCNSLMIESNCNPQWLLPVAMGARIAEPIVVLIACAITARYPVSAYSMLRLAHRRRRESSVVRYRSETFAVTVTKSLAPPPS